MYMGFGERGKLWALDAHIGAPPMDFHSAMIAGIRKNGGYLPARRLIECHVRDQTVAEKCGDALTGPVKELIRHQEFPRSQIFLQRAYGTDGDDPLHAEQFHRINIRAEIDFRREDAMATP